MKTNFNLDESGVQCEASEKEALEEIKKDYVDMIIDGVKNTYGIYKIGVGEEPVWECPFCYEVISDKELILLKGDLTTVLEAIEHEDMCPYKLAQQLP